MVLRWSNARLQAAGLTPAARAHGLGLFTLGLTFALLALAACGGPGAKSQQPAPPVDPSAVRVDLDVDADRDGAIHDVLDEPGEDAWTDDRGAMFMVNYDRDEGGRGGGPDAIGFDERGAPVNEDFVINGAKDALDLTEIVVRVEGIDPGGLESAILRAPALDHVKGVHVFDAIEPGRRSFWGGPGERSTSIDLAGRLASGGETTLGVEGLFFRYTEPMAYGGAFEGGYSGELELELVVTGRGGVFLGSDKVLLRVAPLVLLPNTQEALEMWGRDSSIEYFRHSIQDNGRPALVPHRRRPVDPGPRGDRVHPCARPPQDPTWRCSFPGRV